MEEIKLDQLLEKYKSLKPKISQQKIKDWKWIIDNRNKLTKYEGNWLAIFNGEILAFGKEAEHVMQKAEEVAGDVDYYLRFLEDSGSIYFFK